MMVFKQHFDLLEETIDRLTTNWLNLKIQHHQYFIRRNNRQVNNKLAKLKNIAPSIFYCNEPIVWTTPFFKEEEVYIDYLPRREGKGESEKLKKAVEVQCRRKSSLKCKLVLFNFFNFIIFTFKNYFFLCKIVLLCIGRKVFFFCHHNFRKNDHSQLSKNEPENIPSIKIKIKP